MSSRKVQSVSRERRKWRTSRASSFREGGPLYEVVLDEIGLRRFNVVPDVMHHQLRRIVDLARRHPRLSVRVLPFRTGWTRIPWPMRQITLFTFADPADPPMAVSETTSTDVIHTVPVEVARQVHRYEIVRDEALSEADSLAMIEEIATRISHESGADG